MSHKVHLSVCRVSNKSILLDTTDKVNTFWETFRGILKVVRKLILAKVIHRGRPDFHQTAENPYRFTDRGFALVAIVVLTLPHQPKARAF